MNGIVDTHTHLESFGRKGLLENALESAANAGVSRLVTVGTDSADWASYAEMALARAGTIDYTVGLHPCSVDSDWEEQAAEIAAFWKREKPPVALGEIGLDRFHLPNEEAEAETVYEQQKEAFAAQLRLAKTLGAKVVIHSRGAFPDCVDLIDESGVDWTTVVFHCFSEGPSEMKELLDRGGFGSFTGIITFKKAEAVRDAALLQGLNRLMIETDAPYLAPVPHRGKPNEPAYLAHTAEFCAELFGVEAETFAEMTSSVSTKFFGLE